MKAKKPFKLRSLNSKGVSHLLVPLLVVVTLAVGGTFMLVSSHANNSGVLGQSTNEPTGGTEASTGTTKKKTKKSKIDPNTTKLYVYGGQGSMKSFQVLEGTSEKTAKAAKCGVSPKAGADRRISKTPNMTKSKFNISQASHVVNGVKVYNRAIIVCKDPAAGQLMVKYSTLAKNKAKFSAKATQLAPKKQSCYFVHWDGVNKSGKSYSFMNGKCTKNAGAASNNDSDEDESSESDNPPTQQQLADYR